MPAVVTTALEKAVNHLRAALAWKDLYVMWHGTSGEWAAETASYLDTMTQEYEAALLWYVVATSVPDHDGVAATFAKHTADFHSMVDALNSLSRNIYTPGATPGKENKDTDV